MIKGDFLKALILILGTTIGVGLFGLPYITAKVGLWVMLFFLFFLAGVVLLNTLLYGELVLRTKKKHRFPGYVGHYLGNRGKIFGFIASGLGLIGSLLAYLVIGGEFLFSFLSPVLGGSYFLYVLIYFSLGALLIFFGVKSIAQTEFLLILLFIAILFIIFYQGSSLIRFENLFHFNPAFLFLPYGAVLFSFSTAGSIPEAREMLKNKTRLLRPVIITASLIVISIYLFAIITILGISGQETTQEAINGLRAFLNEKVIILALIFGLLTTFTSFLTIGLTLKKTLWYDGGFSKNLSWLIACFAPLGLFLLGFQSFIEIISLVGGIALAFRSILTILMHRQAKLKGDLKPAYQIKLPSWLACFLILVFSVGIIYEIIYFF